jgi:hypothetical protein
MLEVFSYASQRKHEQLNFGLVAGGVYPLCENAAIQRSRRVLSAATSELNARFHKPVAALFIPSYAGKDLSYNWRLHIKNAIQ